MLRLKVSKNQRFLCMEDGDPFFWLGDTAWELFHCLNKEEAVEYLKTRASQGFNVIQATILAEIDGLGTPNAYGRYPLKKNEKGEYDPCLWDMDGEYSYWDHIDTVLDMAEREGLYVALLPTWGDKYYLAHGVGPVIFTPENALEYGRMIGKRYGNRDNLIWVLGGDRTLMAYEHFKVNEALAIGIRETEEKTHLITLHPGGNQSSTRYFPDASWLDFHMIQSGHNCCNLKNYEFVQHDYAMTPIKPTLDAEPRYEDHPVDFNADNGYFDQADVRQAAYWNVFSGGFGHTYGHHSVWKMNREFSTYFPLAWRDALSRPGAVQMRHIKELLLSKPFFERIPDQTLLEENYSGSNYIAATRGSNYAFFYAPNGVDIKVKMGILPEEKVKADWFCPRTGNYEAIGVFPNEGVQVFSPRFRGRDCDIVLCLASVNQ